MKRAFVLSGGSIRGAFQAGVIADILTSGTFKPDAVYGSSVGSLNGAFLADRAGRAVIAGNAPNWVEIGNELQSFWLKEITSFTKIGKKRGIFQLAYAVIFKKFNGFVDTSTLNDLMRGEIKTGNLHRSPVKFFACAVNVATGKPIYASIESHPESIHDYIVASAALPMIMPLKMIRNDPHTDGGIREVAPLRQAIADGADEIICILCQPENLQRAQINHKNVIELGDQLMAIIANETATNDFEHCEKINELLRDIQQPITSGPLKGKRHIKLNVIRPSKPVGLDLEKFDLPKSNLHSRMAGKHRNRKEQALDRLLRRIH
ncbi:MAG: patatin-like phospholipase family protein [bacterium]